MFICDLQKMKWSNYVGKSNYDRNMQHPRGQRSLRLAGGRRGRGGRGEAGHGGGGEARRGHADTDADHANTAVELVIIAGRVGVYDSLFILSSLVTLR
jgi:hypothetical protein